MAEYDIYLDDASEMQSELTFTYDGYRKSTIELHAWLAADNMFALAYSEKAPELALTYKDNHLYLECQDSEGVEYLIELL